MSNNTPNTNKIPYGYCHCGCGQKTPLSKEARRGYAKGEPLKFIHGHNAHVPGYNRKNTDAPIPNPSGVCHCGCGQLTPIASSTSFAKGRVKGEHTRFCIGHHKSIRQLPDRFWQRVDRRGPDDCWEWKSYINDSGYGVTRGRNNKALRAHRMAYEFTYGPIPDGMFVCHKCDNPACCNPAHLFVGNPRDNVHDMIEKGRASQYSGICGERHGMSKVTSENVREMRELSNNGLSYVELSRRYGISDVQVSRIVRRICWSHLDD